ncbi:hypothetical protein SAMN05216593_103241 [Pseudomonas asturiensis]|uniref:Uncharacterized protein n=1 Tax=Pseudomonas asturiensis TaxID=1190415 RepID=A0A1M7LQD6_9PSED|nr:DUF5677 domain-containing protein [Pseudomonas asturiensis]SHM80390.1 hypothetical protein SAMN05216593_103241 [Pseudomonas asturiensis]
MSTTTALQLLKSAEQILEGLRSLIIRARPPLVSPDRLRVSLVLTIAEQFEAMLHLANAHMSTHAATHVRSMIEALVAMKMLETSNTYIDQMRYEKLKSERRVYKGIIADPHIPEQLKISIKEMDDICHSECEVFRAAGLKPKKISDDIGAAGLGHLVGPYSMLCAFSHNDLAVLAFRHQNETNMVYKQADSPKFVESIISTSLMVLMDATDQFGRLAKFPDNHFHTVFAEMNAKWVDVLSRRGG